MNAMYSLSLFSCLRCRIVRSISHYRHLVSCIRKTLVVSQSILLMTSRLSSFVNIIFIPHCFCVFKLITFYFSHTTDETFCHSHFCHFERKEIYLYIWLFL